ncbi:hypothetical protein BURK2_04021 [Burkholderiales bacterium]|nr:hypothetical protein BURK2_04021 [Burkholderiales bacterium]
MERLTRLVLHRPVVAALVLSALSVFFGTGLLRLRADTGFRAYLGAEHPVVRELDGFIDRFGGGLPVAAVYRCAEPAPCRTVFDRSALEMAAAIARELATLPGVRKVESPATSVLLVPSEDGFAVRRLVERGQVAADADALASRAARDPLWTGSLVSQDGKTGALVVELVSSGSEESVAVVNALRDALRRFEAQGFEFHLVGQSVELLVTDEELAADSARLLPVSMLLIAVTVFFMLRSWSAVVTSLVTMGIATLWTFGTLGWIGWPQNSITQTIGPLLLVIGVSDAIHVLARYGVEIDSSGDETLAERRAAIVAASRDVGNACGVTALTTATGFLAFTTSGAESFFRFGIIASVGILFALVLSFTLLPLLVVTFPIGRSRAARDATAWDGALRLVVDVATRRSRTVLVLAGLLACLCFWGVTRLRVDVDPYSLYGEHSQVVRWARFAEEYLRRPDTLEIGLEVPLGWNVASPEALGDVEKLSAFLPTVDGLGRTRSVLDPLRRAHRLIEGDAPAAETLGADTETNAQLLLLLSLDDPALLQRWMSLDQSHLRISSEAKKEPQSRRIEILATVEAFIRDELAPGWRATLTGPLAVYRGMVDEIQSTQLKTFGTADVVVLLLIAVFVRSLGLALLGMLPNLLPILVTLGLMGVTGLDLDMGTAMVASIVLGISTDDTIHFLGQYRKRRLLGDDPEKAVEAAILHSGRAVVTTSFALTLGFFVLSLSHWQSIASFGVLAGVTILVSLVAELFLLPALLVSFGRRAPPAVAAP